jgi:hypothetical protein
MKVKRNVTDMWGYEVNTKYLSCGTYMTAGRKHLYFPEYKFTEKIIIIAKSLKGKVELDAFGKYYRITMPSNFALKIVFRLFRYIRTPEHKDIVNSIVECLEKGIDPMSSIIIGHSTRNNFISYNPYWDILVANRMYNPVDLEKWEGYLINSKRGYVNHSFSTHKRYSINTHPEFKKACEDKNYKLANKVLNNG